MTAAIKRDGDPDERHRARFEVVADGVFCGLTLYAWRTGRGPWSVRDVEVRRNRDKPNETRDYYRHDVTGNWSSRTPEWLTQFAAIYEAELNGRTS